MINGLRIWLDVEFGAGNGGFFLRVQCVAGPVGIVGATCNIDT